MLTILLLLSMYFSSLPLVSADYTVEDHYMPLDVGDLGDLGGPVSYVPTFFAFDRVVNGYDMSLFIQCYKGLAPPEAVYLGDLGGGVPP